MRFNNVVPPLVREAWAIARSQPVATGVTAAIVAAVCGVILATTGQAAAAEAKVLRGIDDAGTQVIIVEDREGRGQLSASSVNRIANLAPVDWAVGFSAVSDVRNSALGGAASPVPARVVFGELPAAAGVTDTGSAPSQALVGERAARRLGLSLPVGALTGPFGVSDVVGGYVAIQPLEFLNDTVLITPPSDPTAEQAYVRLIYIRIESVDEVGLVTNGLREVIDSRSQEYTIATPEDLVALREVVASELSTTSRQLMIVVLGVGLVVVAVTLFGAVSQRRRDFGRRRALGASRSAVVALVLAQTFIAALLGGVVGLATGSFIVWRLVDALPSPSFTAGVLALSMLSALLAAVPPALIAARRDPVQILRVP